jgi:hypothetical protein
MMRAVAGGGRSCLIVVGLAFVGSLAAQERTTARVARGVVMRPGADSMTGVAGAWVVLHRVASDGSGPLDSVRTARDGRFEIPYRIAGTADAIYFVSAEHHGIAYFSPPLDTSRTVDRAELAVYDTTSAPVPIHVRGRHIVVAAPHEDGSREVVEVYELANDSSVTRVARDDIPLWMSALPDGATNVRVGQGDLSADAIRTDGGRVRLFAPMAPGIKQLSYAYRVDRDAFPLVLPLEASTNVLEVLAEEPNATVTAPGLARVDPVTVEGRTFGRFLAQEVAQGAVLRIEVPRDGAGMRRAWLISLLAATAAAMTLVLVRVSRRRRSPERVSIRPRGGERPSERYAREIAELDARAEAADLTAETRAAYAARRAELKAALTRALDEETARR